MCPERSPQKQQGAGLPIALFIITVLALLVVGMAQLQERSGQAVSLQIQSQRAFMQLRVVPRWLFSKRWMPVAVPPPMPAP